MKYLVLTLLMLISFAAQDYGSSMIYEIDWSMDGQRIVKFDRKSLRSVTQDKDVAMVIWNTGCAECFKLASVYNEVAPKLQKKFKLIAFNPGDDYPTIKRFKKHLVIGHVGPQKPLMQFLETYTFITDLDAFLPKNLYGASAPALVLVKNGKVMTTLKTEEEIKKYFKKKKRKRR
jgi:thiol-disulfide isomerase/thioredoxin